MTPLQHDGKEELRDAAKNWIAMDGLWFQAVEQHYSLEAAVLLDQKVWKRYAVTEARRIKERLQLPEQGGLDALEIAFNNRLFTHVNETEILRPDKKTLVVTTKTCRVQAARERKGIPLFPCRSVGMIEFPLFARTIDPRVSTECLSCPPETKEGSPYCSWKFTLKNEGE
jgi:hypothetical protein